MVVETFQCCLKTLLLLPSNGCNLWPPTHPPFWPHSPYLVPYSTFEFPSYSGSLPIFDFHSVFESSLTAAWNPWDFILPCGSIHPWPSPYLWTDSLFLTLSVHPCPLPYHWPSPYESKWPRSMSSVNPAHLMLAFSLFRWPLAAHKGLGEHNWYLIKSLLLKWLKRVQRRRDLIDWQEEQSYLFTGPNIWIHSDS